MKKKTGVEELLWKNYWVIVILVLIGSLVPYFMIVGLSNYYENNKHNRIQTAKERMEDNYESIPIQDILNHNGSVTIVEGDLSVINLTEKNVFDKEKISQEEWSDFLIASGELNSVCYDIAYNANKDFWLVIGMPVALTIRIDYVLNADSLENANMMNWMVLVILCYFAVIGLGAFFYAKLIAKRLTTPIKNLSQFAVAIEKGNYIQCDVNSSIKELADLQTGINHLSEELKQHEENRNAMEAQRQQMVMEISHDLKNPLASIQGYCELLMSQYTNQEMLTQDKKEAYLGLIHSNAIRSNDLLHSLFTYSKIESQDFSLKLTQINICEYVRLVVADFISVIEEKQFKLDAEIPELNCQCMIDQQMFHRILENLFWNALEYNLPGTEISVKLQQQDKQIEIRFSDNGKGIPHQDVEKIFLPFTRTDEAVRNSREGGSGLGLAIVKKLTVLHGGTIELSSDIGQGCAFIIKLPTI